ncbi:uncharacterized protein TM35_000881090 [Trypanosoma theileri]|uniref:Transglutaminase n=1 Tax=Trypanosoma theileri TaxID=67003 RepID=A0A1X0NEZ1_9TRYP|nr:uncharacterized protein TM35_000881090 [Trypanosoma theileri]ORC82530.1 hypothetical protein TM35_000881090 [Trypanosoma theileri]
MFIQLRRVVYLLVLLQTSVCVVRAEDDAGHGKAVGSLKEWADEAEGRFARGKGYHEVWGTTVNACIKRANVAWDIASGTKEIVAEIINERAKEYPLRDHLLSLVKRATSEVNKNVSVLNEAANAVEDARNLDRMSEDAIMKMRETLESQNKSRNQNTEVLERVDEEKRSVEQDALIRRTRRVYNDMNEVYQKLLVIRRRSHACAREVSNGVIATKNRMLRALYLFGGVKEKLKIAPEEFGEEVTKYNKTLLELLRDELVEIDSLKRDGSKEYVVGRASAKATAGAASDKVVKKKKSDTKKLEAEVTAAQEKEKESLERKKKEEEKEVRRLHEERQRELERKKAEDEERKAAEERLKVQERKKAEEEKKKIKEEEARKAKEEEARKAKEERAKQELERKAREEMEKKKKKKDGSSPALVHSPLLLLLPLVLCCTLVC